MLLGMLPTLLRLLLHARGSSQPETHQGVDGSTTADCCEAGRKERRNPPPHGDNQELAQRLKLVMQLERSQQANSELLHPIAELE